MDRQCKVVFIVAVFLMMLKIFVSCNVDHVKYSGMCCKDSMQADGFVRLSRVEVFPQFIDEYKKYAVEVGEISLRTEPGVLSMYAVQQKDALCQITILETYSSKEAYRKHIASSHFRKYKRGTQYMVKHLELLDQVELNPSNKIINYIE